MEVALRRRITHGVSVNLRGGDGRFYHHRGRAQTFHPSLRVDVDQLYRGHVERLESVENV